MTISTKKYGKGILPKFKDKAVDLLTAYQEAKPTLDSVLQQAAGQRSAWEKTISIFNKRFSVPFEVKIKNQTDLLLMRKRQHYLLNTALKLAKKQLSQKFWKKSF